jgi:hypothetical protein
MNEERTVSVYDKWNIFVTLIFHNGQPSLGGDRKTFKVMTLTMWTLGSVVSLLAATLYQGNPDSNHKLWNIASTERYILHMQVLQEFCYI